MDQGNIQQTLLFYVCACVRVRAHVRVRMLMHMHMRERASVRVLFIARSRLAGALLCVCDVA